LSPSARASRIHAVTTAEAGTGPRGGAVGDGRRACGRPWRWRGGPARRRRRSCSAAAPFLFGGGAPDLFGHGGGFGEFVRDHHGGPVRVQARAPGPDGALRLLLGARDAEPGADLAGFDGVQGQVAAGGRNAEMSVDDILPGGPPCPESSCPVLVHGRRTCGGE
jgi:hypothetical protein